MTFGSTFLNLYNHGTDENGPSKNRNLVSSYVYPFFFPYLLAVRCFAPGQYTTSLKLAT